jgi:hypothetical protein
MKNEQATTNGRNRKLLPLIALIVGLCVPIYAYADQGTCEACHNWCQNVYAPIAMNDCAQNGYAWGSPEWNTCVGNKMAWCHTDCWYNGSCN